VLLLAGESAGADVVRVRPQSLQRLAANVRESLHELRLVSGVHAEQVVEDEDLSVGRRPCADPDHRDLELRHQRFGHSGGDRLEDDCETPDGLQGQGLLGELRRRLCGATLCLESPERRRGLRGQADVTQNRDPRAHDRAGSVDGGATALELDGLAAGLLDEALSVRDRLLVRALVGAEGHVADQQRVLEAAADGARHHQHLLHADRRGGVVAEDDHRGGVSDQDDVDARLVDDLRRGVVISGDHHDPLAGALHLRDPRQSHLVVAQRSASWSWPSI
jgi:hypothetical protein